MTPRLHARYRPNGPTFSAPRERSDAVLSEVSNSVTTKSGHTMRWEGSRGADGGGCRAARRGLPSTTPRYDSGGRGRCRACRVLPCRQFQCDGSSHVDASTKVWISNWRRRHSEDFEDAINRPVRLPMAATDRDHAIQPVVVCVCGLE